MNVYKIQDQYTLKLKVRCEKMKVNETEFSNKDVLITQVYS